MDTFYSGVEWLGLAVVGVLLRVGFAAAIILVVTAALLPFVYGVEGVRRWLLQLRGVEAVRGLEWRSKPFYSSAHLWLRDRGRVVRLGLDGVAARLLARSEDVLLPAVGTALAKGTTLALFQAGTRRVAVPSPIDGVVTSVNSRVNMTPAVATHAPYGAGWLVEMSPTEGGWRTMPRAAAARQWFDTEAARLQLALDRAREISAADGGVSMVPPGHLLSDQQFEQLAAELLQATVVKA